MSEFMSNEDNMEVIKSAELKKHTIEVHGKPIANLAYGDKVTIDDCKRSGEQAGYRNIAVYDLKQYLETNGNCRRLNPSDFPYDGSVMVTDVNVAGN